MAAVNQAIDFLRGRLGEVEKDIEREMAAAAAAQEFEKAALLRDRLAAVRHVHERQSARVDEREAFDVIGLSLEDPGANVQVFRVRDGAVVDRQAFYLENAAGREAAEVLEEFLLEFYWEGSVVPPEIVAPLEDGAGLGAVLGERRGSRVAVRAAKRGPKRRLLELAQHNADLAAQTESERLARRSASRIEALERLRDGLALDRLPLRIECYDISNLGEQHPVGSMVVFEGGVPKKAHYRKFSVRDADRTGRLRDDEPGAAAALRAPRRRRRRRTTRASRRCPTSWSWTAARGSSPPPSPRCADAGATSTSSASPSSARRSSCPAAATRCRCRPTTRVAAAAARARRGTPLRGDVP